MPGEWSWAVPRRLNGEFEGVEPPAVSSKGNDSGGRSVSNPIKRKNDYFATGPKKKDEGTELQPKAARKGGRRNAGEDHNFLEIPPGPYDDNLNVRADEGFGVLMEVGNGETLSRSWSQAKVPKVGKSSGGGGVNNFRPGSRSWLASLPDYLPLAAASIKSR